MYPQDIIGHFRNKLIQYTKRKYTKHNKTNPSTNWC